MGEGVSWDKHVGILLFAAIVVAFPPLRQLVGFYLNQIFHPVLAHASAIGLCLAVLSVGGVVFMSWNTGSDIGIQFVVRMVAPLLLLSVLSIAVFAILWYIIHNLFWMMLFILINDLFGTNIGPLVSVPWVFTAGLLAVIVLFQFHRLSNFDRQTDATLVTAEDFPTVHALTTKVAAQLDIPVPTIAVSEHAYPEAMTIGYRPENIYLLLSAGTLDALNESELEAVIAHELAHVANMDTMVMTIASLPGRLAERFNNILLLILPPLILVVILKDICQPAVAALSRARELAADRTAAAVTGSPAVLASALGTLDERIAETPAEDLRDVSNLSSMSILSLDSSKSSGLSATHPSTEYRIEALTESR